MRSWMIQIIFLMKRVLCNYLKRCSILKGIYIGGCKEYMCYKTYLDAELEKLSLFALLTDLEEICFLPM